MNHTFEKFFTKKAFLKENNEYVLKYAKKPVLVDSQEELDLFGQELNEVNQNKDKNEKISVVFRAIDKANQQIINCSEALAQKTTGELLTYKDIVVYLKEYDEYLQKAYGNIYNLTYYIDIIKLYYPLEQKNKIENISREDVYIVNCYNNSEYNSQFHECKASMNLLKANIAAYCVEEENN